MTMRRDFKLAMHFNLSYYLSVPVMVREGSYTSSGNKSTVYNYLPISAISSAPSCFYKGNLPKKD